MLKLTLIATDKSKIKSNHLDSTYIIALFRGC